MSEELDKSVSDQVLKELKSGYEEIYSCPSVSGGVLSQDGSITLNMSLRDFRNNASRSYQQIFYTNGQSKYQPVGFPVQTAPSVHATSASPKGDFTAVFNKTGKDDEPGFGHTKAVDYQIEIWNQSRIVKQIIVKDLHGKVTNDQHFGRTSWFHYQDGSIGLLYVAEIKTSPPKTLFDKDYDRNKPSHFDLDNQEDWGEGLVGQKKPRAFLCRFHPSDDSYEIKTEQVNGVPDNVALSSPVFTPDGDGIVFVGYDVSQRRLGLMYCVQRQSTLYHVSFKENDQAQALTGSEQWNARRPVFDPRGHQLVFLSTGQVPYHMSCNKLMILEWPSRNIKTCIDVVHDYPSQDDSFPGIYTTDLHHNCWNNDDVYISTIWRSTMAVIKVNTKTNSVTKLNPYTLQKDASLQFLDQRGNELLLLEQSPVVPYKVILATLHDDDEQDHSLQVISQSQIPSSCKDITWHVESQNTKDGSLIECIYIIPSPHHSNHALIVSPHGGPHSTYTTTFISSLLYYARQGFTLCLVNYRGSIGFGQSYIQSLPGKCGTLDVSDVHEATLRSKSKFLIDDDLVCVIGGSHGGFLSAHMVGQYPDLYKATVMRNPVTNIATLSAVTDIPDWSFVEAMGGDMKHYEQDNHDFEIVKRLFESSPMKFVDFVKCPVLLLLGREDRRVPVSQGREYYYALRKRGVDVKSFCYAFNDHPIGKPEAEADSTVLTVLWLRKYLLKL
ncbi:acylamino-acid-releasing enzyme [Acrasis kona]|uniref:acylaminoacyl-peptidase n=1 Tax=Acrasis kona TaxID=1008807 RepID=A0AAW2ZJX7_9EUKA